MRSKIANAESSFLEDLIDACVLECYFREHMAERDLLFHDTVAPHLAAYDTTASETQQRSFLTDLHATLNAPSHPIRNRLLRLTADRPRPPRPHQGRGPRMKSRLHKIEIRNFKAFREFTLNLEGRHLLVLRCQRSGQILPLLGASHLPSKRTETEGLNLEIL